MVRVTRLNGDEIVINAGMIEQMEATPDTLITLTTGHKLFVKEAVDQVIERVIAFERAIGSVGRYGRQSRVKPGEPPDEEDS